MVEGFSSPRLLMNRLRGLMAEGGETSERLERIVSLIAGTMVADVCSVYVRTDADELVLAATQGLDPRAINNTRLKLDEGLVGHIALTAEHLAIQDAPRHPAFSYRPETGEDPYHAFLGVPILRNGRVIGVLTVQNQTERVYEEDEIETLQTIAMVMAEVIAVDGVTGHNGNRVIGDHQRPANLAGRVLCGGLAMGRAHLHDPVVPPAKFFAADPAFESQRLTDAMQTLRFSVDHMLAADASALGGDPREILETYRMLANDPGWATRLMEGARSGLSAEASVDRARREHRVRLESARDPYLRERLFDLEDLDNRLLRILGGADSNSHVADAAGRVLIARRLGPADLLEYANAGLKAIVLEETSAASHAAIVARALDLPTIGGVENVTTSVEAGRHVIVDAEEGILHIQPDEALREAYTDRVSVLSQREEIYRQLSGQPAVTQDGVRIELFLNAGLNLDLDHIDEVGADGIGLFRTEFQFLVLDRLPTLDEQTSLYARVIDAAKGRKVLFRTIDLGADKLMIGSRGREENPALGWRSIRLALDQKGLFRRQMRALIRAAAGRPLSIMFPMVTTAEEFFEARALLDREIEWNKLKGHPLPLHLEVGAMLEVPALAFELDILAGAVDFISIGTNDLMQFFHAADRMLPAVSERYDVMQPAALKFLKQIIDDCERLNIPVSVCGELAGQPVEALALLALGCRRLSMAAGDIGPIKRLVRSLHLEAFTNAFFDLPTEGSDQFRKKVLGLAGEYSVEHG